MEFIVGPIPENQDSKPDNQGWTLLREPKPKAMMLRGLVMAVVLGLGALLLWIAFAPLKINEFNLLWSLVAIPFCVPLHEVSHALAFPAAGWNDRTVFGFWPSRLAFYAYYRGCLSRNRTVTILVFPFLLLSIVPLLTCGVLGIAPSVVVYASICNAFLSSIDLVSILLVLSQVPGKAVIRQQDGKAWWIEEDHS